jgi:hypothetical protein
MIRPQFLPRTLILVSSLLVSFEIFGVNRQSIAKRNRFMLRIESIQSGKNLVVAKYSWSDTFNQTIQDVEFDFKDKQLLESFPIFFYQPDWKYELLRRGVVRLSNPSFAFSTYRSAEQEAKTKKLGIWKGQTNHTLPPSPATRLRSPNRLEALNKLLAGLSWRRIQDGIAQWGGVSACIAAVFWIISQAIRISRRVEVSLILLGPKSAGKSWLWARLDNSEISVADLGKLGPTPSVKKSSKQVRPKLLGRFEVHPYYVDVPGGEPGRHFEEMTRKRLLKRNKTIFLLTLSTTPAVGKDPDNHDLAYISEQLGYTALPLGLITAGKTKKPSMCIIVITKFDLYSDREPKHSSSANAVKSLKETFKPHIARLEEACKSAGIPFDVLFCSAREGWGVDSIYNRLEKGLFS